MVGAAWTRLGAVLLACACIGSCSTFRTPARPAAVRPTSPVHLAPPPADRDVNEAILQAHNVERTRRRRPPLVLNPELTQAAQAHADDMARRGKMAHRGGDGSSPFERMKRVGYSFQAAGENVAYGFDRVDAVMAGWMHSPGHRRNILGDYTEIGVGRAIAPGGVLYYCVTFGTPGAGDFP